MKFIKRFWKLKTKNINSYYLGKIAEKKAVKYLKKHSWKIIKVNYRNSITEIDIIAIKEAYLVAFEVKYRAREDILPYSVSYKQKSNVGKALLVFQKYYRQYFDYKLRVDVILISKNTLDHITNV